MPKTNTRKSLLTQIAVAIGLSILLLLVGYFGLSMRYSTDALVEEFYIPVEEIAVSTKDAPLLKGFQRAHDAFQEEKYQEAITLFQQVRLLSNQTDADPAFRRLIEEGSRFNLQLARLADGALDLLVIQDLRGMSRNQNHTHAERAERLIERLESRWRGLVYEDRLKGKGYK